LFVLFEKFNALIGFA